MLQPADKCEFESLFCQTVLCVTQDFSTVQVLDDVIVIDQGRLAEYGPQADLMNEEASLFARMKRRMQGFSLNSKGQPTISAEVLKSTWAFNGVELNALKKVADAFTARYFRENEVDCTNGRRIDSQPRMARSPPTPLIPLTPHAFGVCLPRVPMPPSEHTFSHSSRTLP